MISARPRLDPLYFAQAAELVSEWKGLLERGFVVQTWLSAKGFSVVLMGKGKEKFFAVDDAVPMRQPEIRKTP